VFDRERKIAAHVRRPHALELARRHPAGKDQSLGPPAQRPVQGAHLHLAGERHGHALPADLGPSGSHIPQCLRRLLGHGLPLPIAFLVGLAPRPLAISWTGGKHTGGGMGEASSDAVAAETGSSAFARRLLFAALVAATTLGVLT